MVIKKIWFDNNHIFGEDENGKVHSQSLLWYPNLMTATDDERGQYHFGFNGIHWRNLNEDISFESFGYEDAEPGQLQKFFLTHKELNVAEFAKRAGIDATLLKNYINGFKRPSKELEEKILNSIHAIGREYTAVTLQTDGSFAM